MAEGKAMRYERPEIDIFENSACDLLTVSGGYGTPDYVPGGSDLPLIDANEDSTGDGYAGN